MARTGSGECAAYRCPHSLHSALDLEEEEEEEDDFLLCIGACLKIGYSFPVLFYLLCLSPGLFVIFAGLSLCGGCCEMFFFLST